MAISQKAARDGRAAVLARYAPAAANRDGIEEGELASLITEALERRLRSWRPFPQPVRKPRASKTAGAETGASAPSPADANLLLCGHAFTPENTIRVRSAEAARSADRRQLPRSKVRGTGPEGRRDERVTAFAPRPHPSAATPCGSARPEPGRSSPVVLRSMLRR